MVHELSEKISQLEQQKQQLDEDAKRLHTQEEKLTTINKELASEKESLVAERNKLSVILEGVTDPVIAVDYDRTVTMFNAAAEKLTGYRAEDVIGHVIERVLTLFTPGGDLVTPHEYCPIRSDTFEGIVYQGEELRLRTNNNDLYVNVTSSKIAESESANLGCIVTLHDITNERELSRMKLDFVSMAAHELRTPLTTIRGYLEMIKQETLDKLTPQQQMFINRIGIATQQLTGLMENLLSVAKIEKGNYNLTLSQVDWVSLVSNQVETLRPEAKDRGLELNWIQPDNDIPLVHVDPLRITEVLNNLLANAIKYTAKGSVSVWVEHKKDDNIVVTHIKDTGQGIPKESLPRMFEKFFRVSGLLEQGSKGTGLGLYITKAIVELHNGSIWVESEEGVGSIFSFSIPVAKDNNSERVFNS
jgi:PAS domain S-box-containing protein